MIITERDIFEDGETNPKCVRCGELLEDKWITIWEEIGDLRIYCAQHTMRILLEDIIEYHNGTHISLLNIMYHGDKEEMEGMLIANKELGENIAAINLEKQRMKEHYAKMKGLENLILSS